MTPYENPLAINGLPGRAPAEPRTCTEEPQRGPCTRPHLTARLVLAAVLETAVLLGTFQVLAGIGLEAQAGWAPTPGGVAPAGNAAPHAHPR